MDSLAMEEGVDEDDTMSVSFLYGSYSLKITLIKF
jgi:hypothetical protein